MREYSKFYIGGEWVEPVSAGRTIDVDDSATEEVVGRVPEGNAADVDAAVAAARAAFESWSSTPVDVRAKYLRDISAALAGQVGRPRRRDLVGGRFPQGHGRDGPGRSRRRRVGRATPT